MALTLLTWGFLDGPGPDPPHLGLPPTPPTGQGLYLSSALHLYSGLSCAEGVMVSNLAMALVHLDHDLGLVFLTGPWTCIVTTSLFDHLSSWLKLPVDPGPALLIVLRYCGAGFWVVSSSLCLAPWQEFPAPACREEPRGMLGCAAKVYGMLRGSIVSMDCEWLIVG